MNRKIFVAAALATALALPLAANAADQSGWYVALDVGQAHYTGIMGQVEAIGGIPPASSGVTTHVSNNDTGYRLSGGYKFNEYWGLEASWVDLGTAEGDGSVTSPSPGSINGKIKSYGFVVAGTGTYPFNDQWSIFLRLGMINAQKEVDVTASGSLAPAAETTSSTDWKTTYGAGLNWNFYSNWAARIGWDQYRNLGNQNKTGEDNVNLASVGIVYKF